MTRREKQWGRILSTSLLDVTVPSDEVSSNSDCENRTGTNQIWFESRLWNSTCRFLAWPVAIFEKKKWCCRYVTRRPWWYPRIIWGASLDGASYVLSIPLREIENRKSWKFKSNKSAPKQRIEVLHLFRWSTHTPRCREATQIAGLDVDQSSMACLWLQSMSRTAACLMKTVLKEGVWHGTWWSNIWRCHWRRNFFNCDWRFGERDQGARKADALGAGFPCHHLIDASMAVKDSVRKGSWVLLASRRRA